MASFGRVGPMIGTAAWRRAMTNLHETAETLEDWKQAAEIEASVRRRAYAALIEIRDRAPRDIQEIAERIVGKREDAIRG